MSDRAGIRARQSGNGLSTHNISYRIIALAFVCDPVSVALLWYFLNEKFQDTTRGRVRNTTRGLLRLRQLGIGWFALGRWAK